jgi:hypothetical protein
VLVTLLLTRDVTEILSGPARLPGAAGPVSKWAAQGAFGESAL